MSFSPSAVAFWFFQHIRAFILWLLLPEKTEKEERNVVAEQLAEINGEVWERMSIFAHIEQGLKRNPNGPAVICTFQPSHCLHGLVPKNERIERQDSEWQYQMNSSNSPNETVQPKCLTLTYTQLHRTALKLAIGLIANGAQPSTTMVMLIPNSAEYTILLWTCVLLRITYVSLDPILLDESESLALKHLLQTLKPQIVVASDRTSGKTLDVVASELQLPQPIRICLSGGHSPGWKTLASIATDAENCAVEEAALLDAARHDNLDRVNSIMFTSGTSGRPKGCPQRVAGMSHVLHSQRWLIGSEDGAMALQQPHNSRGIAPAQTLQTWNAGGAVVMTGQNFSVCDAVEAIRRFGVTFMVLTPPMVHEFAAELAARPLEASSVKKIQVGGDAVTKDVLMKCAALFPTAHVCVNHGMTEGGGSFVWPFFGTPVRNIPFFGEICPIGAVAPGSVVRIWDVEKGRVAERGELGELHISCASIIRHYMEGRSEESFYDDSKGRWFNTGDMAMVDRDGLVYILGRRKDMILRAGVAVMPAAIESSIEAFTSAQVSGVSSVN